MKNVLRKPIAIALTTLVLAGQTGVSSMVAFAAEEANTNGTQGIQGRAGVTVNVGTATELRNAMTNASVTDIYITANITLPAANVQGKGSKHIYGQGYTVDFANGNIYGDYNSVNTAQDLTIRNAGTYGGFFGGTGYSENTYKDVHFTGATQIMFNAGYAKLTLEGNITVDSTVSEAIYASNVTVKSGADVDISSTKSAIYIEQNKVNALPSALTTEAGSSLLVHSKTGHAFFGARLAAAAVTLGGDANFISDATYAYYDEAAYYNQAASKALDLLPGSDTLILGGQSSKYTAFYGDLNIRDNADIFIQAYSTTEAAAIFANKGLVAAPDANFRIVSASGNAIGGKVSSGTSKVVLQSTIGLSTWNLTTPSNSKPTNEYQFSKAEFSLLGWAPSVITASNLNSDSAAFNTSFNPNLVREIAYGSYSTLADKEKELVEAAETSVKDLFNNGDVNGTIKDTTDQAAIDKAQEAINKVTDPAKKADLQKNLDEAQKQLNDRDNAVAEKARQEAAETSVNDLFNNGDVEGTIKDTTDQAAIDKAQEAINKVTDPAKKADLQKNLDEAQKQLNDRDNAAAEKARQEAAETSVKDLFNNGDVNGTIKDTT
ncbi:toxin Cry1Ac domain D-VI-related protein, partial [Listeria booriae]|uniref:toxin Cry1Ac domain D-VI-related protein n=1 Tax=Listeria booriae TaxID=1552123 RepID=UPI0017AB661D